MRKKIILSSRSSGGQKVESKGYPPAPDQNALTMGDPRPPKFVILKRHTNPNPNPNPNPKTAGFSACGASLRGPLSGGLEPMKHTSGGSGGDSCGNLFPPSSTGSTAGT